MAKDQIDVFVNGGKPVSQPTAFRCCPLGLQFFCEKELDIGRELALKIDAPPGRGMDGMVDVTGIVVHCQFDKDAGMHKAWVIFIDIPPDVCESLECLANEENILCPHCMNFRKKVA